MTGNQTNPKRTLGGAEAIGNQSQSAEEVARTDKAWERLMMTLGQEQPSPAWTKLGQLGDESGKIDQTGQGRGRNREGNAGMKNNEKWDSVQNEGTTGAVRNEGNDVQQAAGGHSDKIQTAAGHSNAGNGGTRVVSGLGNDGGKTADIWKSWSPVWKPMERLIRNKR